MNDASSLPGHAPFDTRQTDSLNALLPTLSGQQASWLSGYLAGFSAQGGGQVAGAVPAGQQPLTILFGSESGNAENCAAQAGDSARKAGFKPKIVDMAEYSPQKLAQDENVLVIVSTWGEGDPPESATDFHGAIMGEGAPKLDRTQFAVFALGDTSYADFCECGKQFDRRFTELGATRVHDRVDADLDFEEPFSAWLEAVLPKLADSASSVSVVTPASSGIAAPTETYGKKNPFPAPVTELINMNGRGSAKLTCHVEFSLAGSGLTYEPGDVVGIIPKNCPEVVDDFLECAKLDGSATVDDDGGSPLREVLTNGKDITSLNASLMKKYAAVAKNTDLEAFLQPEKKDALKDWLWGREVRDLFLAYPPEKPLNPDEVLGFLRKMPPRLYSIASSLRAHPDEVHLTVGAVFYEGHGRQRKGVCSSYLCERIEPGDTVQLYTHPNKHFFLPDDGDTPIIMVGPGTGIAPFRAFVEEREILGAKGRNWLFFGDQHFNTDFLYQTEWQKVLKSGLLTRMDVAFSRDTDHKIYVQHRMKEQARDLYAWLQEGAYFYVCGDANRMAKDVHEALIQIHAEEGGLSREDAEAAVKELQKAKRYQRDVY